MPSLTSLTLYVLVNHEIFKIDEQIRSFRKTNWMQLVFKNSKSCSMLRRLHNVHAVETGQAL